MKTRHQPFPWLEVGIATAVGGAIGYALGNRQSVVPAGDVMSPWSTVTLPAGDGTDHPANPVAIAEIVTGQRIHLGDDRAVVRAVEAALGAPIAVLLSKNGPKSVVAGINSPVVRDKMTSSKQYAYSVPDAKNAALGSLVLTADTLLARLKIPCAKWIDLDANAQEAALKSIGLTGQTASAALAALYIKCATPGGFAGIGFDFYWINPGPFAASTPSVVDPVQGAIGDCYFISSLASLAWTAPEFILRGGVLATAIPAGTPSDTRTGPAFFNFFRGPTHRSLHMQCDGRGPPAGVSYVRVPRRVPFYLPPGNGWWVPFYARGVSYGQAWPAVFEKAFAVWVAQSHEDRVGYDLSGEGAAGFGAMCFGQALTVLTGRPTYGVSMMEPTTEGTPMRSPDELFAFVRTHSRADGRALSPMTTGTRIASPDVVGGIVNNHAYSLLGWIERGGRKYIVLRNPWGAVVPTDPTLTLEGSWQGLVLNSYGVFAYDVSEVFRRFFYASGVDL